MFVTSGFVSRHHWRTCNCEGVTAVLSSGGVTAARIRQLLSAVIHLRCLQEGYIA